MIISEYKLGPTIQDTDRMINQIVKRKIEKMTNETLDELEKVVRRLERIRKEYKSIMIETPELDQAIKAQINELNRINQWIEKEVE